MTPSTPPFSAMRSLQSPEMFRHMGFTLGKPVCEDDGRLFAVLDRVEKTPASDVREVDDETAASICSMSVYPSLGSGRSLHRAFRFEYAASALAR